MPIQLKRSAVAGKVPTTAQLSLGELAVNTNDGRLFLKKDDGTEEVVELLTTLSPLRGIENRVINGAFDFWQRGTSFTALGYGADRWVNDLVGGTVTMSRQSFTLGDTLGNNSPTYFLRQSVSGQSLASHYAFTGQKVEGVRSYAGQTVTVLGWARRSSGTGNMAVECYQWFGTGGSPSALVQGISPTTVTLTGSWAPFAAVITVPSISGKTLGTDGMDHLGLRIWTSAGSDFNARTNSLGLQTIGVDLWGIHIKVGTHTVDATSLYRQPELGPELARCQRYFCKSYSLNTGVGAVTNSGAVQIWTGYPTTLTNFYGSVSVRFPVNMRAAPSVAIYNPFISNTQGSFRAQNQNANLSAVSQDASTGGVVLYINNQNVISADALRGHYIADAEL